MSFKCIIALVAGLITASLVQLTLGECWSVRVRYADENLLINGFYFLSDETCDERNSYFQYDSRSIGHGVRHYIQYGTKDGRPGWAIVQDFCTVNTVELAVAEGGFDYPFSLGTLGNWRTLGSNATWDESSLTVSCESLDYDYYGTSANDAASTAGLIVGLIVGLVVTILVFCCLRALCRRHRDRRIQIQVRSSQPPTYAPISSSTAPDCVVTSGRTVVSHSGAVYISGQPDSSTVYLQPGLYGAPPPPQYTALPTKQNIVI